MRLADRSKQKLGNSMSYECVRQFHEAKVNTKLFKLLQRTAVHLGNMQCNHIKIIPFPARRDESHFPFVLLNGAAAIQLDRLRQVL